MKPNLWWGLGLNKVCLPSGGVLLQMVGGRAPGREKCAGLRFSSHSVRNKGKGDEIGRQRAGSSEKTGGGRWLCLMI